MLNRSTIESLIPILKKDLKRTRKMRVKGFPGVYYSAFLLRDSENFNTWASAGSIYKRQSDRERTVYCDIRVGDYRSDQVIDGGLKDNDEEADSYNHVKAPIDDHCYDGLRLALWRLSEARFREALEDYNTKESAGLSTIDPSTEYPSFLKHKRAISIKYAKPETVDEDKWVKFCKTASQWMSGLPTILSSWIEFESNQISKIFINTEGSVVVQHSQVFSIIALLRKINDDGSNLEQELVINCGSQKELPNMREFKRLALEKHAQLLELAKAKQIHSFSGPVLLYPGPAGVFVHEAIGHRLEGSRLLSSGEGQTLKGQIGKKVLSVPLNIRDNPKLKRFKGELCIGAYDYDDEGIPAKDARLIEGGVLKEFLNTRQPLSKKGHQPNGHARNCEAERPISRMAVTIINTRNGVSLDQMREMLIREINRQRRPYGLIVYATSGGETETQNYDFQAFSGEISYATLVYPDGREECVRGVDFVGTPLQSLNSIMAIGSELELNNAYCGAESGFIPISTISPAILLRNFELQAKDEERVTPYILGKPKLTAGRE